MKRAVLISTLLALTPACSLSATAGDRAVLAPEASHPASEAIGLKVAIFSGGCFWGVEGTFSHVRGVVSAINGYHGGARAADYETVSTGGSGHAESVRVTYDPSKVRYDQLLRIFFSVIADPTTLNRQGPDEGLQYRSALVPMNAQQRAAAAAYLAQLGASHLWRAPIVTRIEAFRRFYPAEDYHQDFMARNPRHPYILAWDVAKVEALKRQFPALYKPGFTTG
jgi:peptide-methionine (S)-S-oxide reductase